MRAMFFSANEGLVRMDSYSEVRKGRRVRTSFGLTRLIILGQAITRSLLLPHYRKKLWGMRAIHWN